MMTRKSLKYVPFALCATGIALLFLSGCGKKEEPAQAVQKPRQPGVSSVAERMADPAYVKQLEAQGAERDELVGARGKLTVQVQRMLKDMRAKMPGADAAAVKAALEKDPEYQSVIARIRDLGVNLDANREKTQAIVRERMMRTDKTISK